VVGLGVTRVRVTRASGHLVGLLPPDTKPQNALLVGHDDPAVSSQLWGWCPLRMTVVSFTPAMPSVLASVAASVLLDWAQASLSPSETPHMFRAMRALLLAYQTKLGVKRDKKAHKIATQLRKWFAAPQSSLPFTVTNGKCICPLHHKIATAGTSTAGCHVWRAVTGAYMCHACADFTALCLPANGFSSSGELVPFFASAAPVILSTLKQHLEHSGSSLCRRFAAVLDNILTTPIDWVIAAAAFRGPAFSRPPKLLIAVRNRYLTASFTPEHLDALARLYPEVASRDLWPALAELANTGITASQPGLGELMQVGVPSSSYQEAHGFVFRASAIARWRIMMSMVATGHLQLVQETPPPLTAAASIAAGIMGGDVVIPVALARNIGQPNPHKLVLSDGREFHLTHRRRFVLEDAGKWPLASLDCLLRLAAHRHTLLLIYTSQAGDPNPPYEPDVLGLLEQTKYDFSALLSADE
jgi:hypothetical protein